MAQRDNTAENTDEPGTGAPAPADEYLVQYLQQIQPYRDTIRQVADVFRNEYWVDIVKNAEKIKSYEKQIIGVLNSLEKLGANPADISPERFNKRTVEDTLRKARVELGKIMFLLQDSDRRVAATSIDHFPDLQEYLDIAEQLMSSILPFPQGD